MLKMCVIIVRKVIVMHCNSRLKFPWDFLTQVIWSSYLKEPAFYYFFILVFDKQLPFVFLRYKMSINSKVGVRIYHFKFNFLHYPCQSSHSSFSWFMLSLSYQRPCHDLNVIIQVFIIGINQSTNQSVSQFVIIFIFLFLDSLAQMFIHFLWLVWGLNNLPH